MSTTAAANGAASQNGKAAWPGRARAEAILWNMRGTTDRETVNEVAGLVRDAPTDEDRLFVVKLFVPDLPKMNRIVMADRYTHAGFVGLVAHIAVEGLAPGLARELAGPDAPLAVRLMAEHASMLWARVLVEEFALDRLNRKIGDKEVATRERRLVQLSRRYVETLKTLAETSVAVNATPHPGARG